MDAVVLDLIERMCHRFQILTGRTNVWLAFHLTNLSIIVYFVWVITLYWLSGDFALRAFVALFCGGVFVVLTRTIFKTSIESAEANAYRRVARGIRNPRRLRDEPLRISFLMIFGVTTAIVYAARRWLAFTAVNMRFAILMEALIALTTIVLYLLACDPLPPREAKVKEWVRSRSPSRIPA